MFSSFYKASLRRNFPVIVVSRCKKPCFLQRSSFSSAAIATRESTSKISNEKLFVVNYLINTLGFSPEKAISASKYINFESTEKPESFIAFFKNHGFNQGQIGRLVRNYPGLILHHPKSLLPKIEFFKSLRLSETEVTKILLKTPFILARNLEKRIIPSFNYIKSLFDANGTSICYLKHAMEACNCDLQSRLLPNVAVLKEAGVPDSRIVYLLQHYPRALTIDAERFRKIVEDVREIGINPVGSTFVMAVYVLQLISKSDWENKTAVYTKWGVSEDEIISAFRKHPGCMIASVDKIMVGMNFFVNELGLESSYVLKAPSLVLYSLDKRLKPRSSVYKILVDNGIFEKGSHLPRFFQCTEEEFMAKFVQRCEEHSPGLLKLCQKELAASKSRDLQKR